MRNSKISFANIFFADRVFRLVYNFTTTVCKHAFLTTLYRCDIVYFQHGCGNCYRKYVASLSPLIVIVRIDEADM